MFIVDPGLQDEGLQVTNLNYRMVLLPAHGVTPCTGDLQLRPDPQDGTLFSFHACK